MKTSFKGIILQPISKKKYPWSQYDNERDNFLEFFQSNFQSNISNDFHVNYNTEDFNNYLLIPYFDKQCFGSYYIKEGKSIVNEDYSHCFQIDYDRSNKFLKKIFHYEIYETIEFYGGTVNKVANDNRIFYYQISELNDKCVNFILNQFIH